MMTPLPYVLRRQGPQLASDNNAFAYDVLQLQGPNRRSTDMKDQYTYMPPAVVPFLW